MQNDHSRRSVSAQLLIVLVALICALLANGLLNLAVTGAAAMAVKANVDAADSSAVAGDVDGTLAAVRSMRANLDTLSTAMDQPLMLAAGPIPVFDRTVHQWAGLLDAANEVAASSSGLLDVVATVTTDANSSTLIPPAALDELAPAGTQLGAALTKLAAALDAVDVNSLPESVRSAALQAQALIDPLTSLVKALPTIAVLLGANQPQVWMLAMQTGGESRGTGGLVGSFAIARVVDGKPEVIRTGSDEDFIAAADSSLLPLDSQELWGKRRLEKYYGLNLSGHYPYAGQLLWSLWQRQTTTSVDAVISFDQHVAADLLLATGPIKVDGVTLDAANALEFLSVGIYGRYPDPREKNLFVGKLMQTLTEQMTSGNATPSAAFKALMNDALAGRILMWARDPSQQKQLAATVIGGEVPQGGNTAMAVINNNAGNKLDAFLHVSVTYSQEQCIAAGRRSTIRVHLANDAPTGLPEYVAPSFDYQHPDVALIPGNTDLRVSVYLPANSISRASADNLQASGTERGHHVLTFAVPIARGQSTDVVVPFTQFDSPTVLNERPKLKAQPMFNPQEIHEEVGPVCG